MPVTVFDLFTIGIGPSSSHTVGPMRAAHFFVTLLESKKILSKVDRLQVEVYGSLAFTGDGHGTDKAILLGLEGESPEKVDPESVNRRVATIHADQEINLLSHRVPFYPKEDLIYNTTELLPYHPNAMRFVAFSNSGRSELLSKVYYSCGGGFVVDDLFAEESRSGTLNPTGTSLQGASKSTIVLPYPFTTGAELLAQCEKSELSIAQLMWENEKVWRSEDEIRSGLLSIWDAMDCSIERGCHSTEKILPGGLGVRRRAPKLAQQLQNPDSSSLIGHDVLDFVTLYALAVNEENAAGGRVVTAPTNGASGVIPAVIRYYKEFTTRSTPEGIMDFLLVAAAIGILYKKGASLSAAEMGCQGEVGVACSMAAGALAAVLGGSNLQVENAAEIGMEHNLGLTCDPVKGLVQIPCIERNTMGAIKAINAARLALREDEANKVTLDQVIKTMRDTGRDMKAIYRETSQGGLAINVPEC